MALKTTNKNRVKPSIVEAKVELKQIIEESPVDEITMIKDKKYYNDEYIDEKINYKAFFGFLALLAIVSFFVI